MRAGRINGKHGNRMQGTTGNGPSPFLQNMWYAAALDSDVAAEPFARTICDEEIVFFRRSDDAVIALEDRCPHRQAPLSLGTVSGDHIRCGYHGLVFDADGVCIDVPGQDQIPPQACVRAYPVEERDGWIWIGDPAAADAASVPPLPYFDVPGWSGFQKYFHVKAAAQLFIDNLLDLSHVPFTHANSIGAASAADAPAEMGITVEADLIRGERLVRDVEPGRFIADWGGFAGRIDRHAVYTWRPPSVMEIRSRFSDAEDGITIMIINPVTPETATSSHFWIGWARDFRLGDDVETAKAVEQNTQVILEDVRIIEAQQKRLDRRPDVKPMPIKADKAVIAVQRFIDRLHRQQHIDGPAT